MVFLVKCILSLGLFLSPLVQAKKLSSRVQIPITKYKLKNGMTILLNPDKGFKMAAYTLGVRVGSRHERRGHTGISHMFEHLMFRGTKKYPEFDKTYSQNGVVSINATTSVDRTNYFGEFPSYKLEHILDVESDRFSNLILTQERLDKERHAVQEERKLRIDNKPRGFLGEKFFATLFIKHPYGQPVIGYPEDIAGYKLVDLKNWYRTYYSPNNLVLALSGNFSTFKAKRLIKKYFGRLKSQEIPQEKVVQEPVQKKPRELRFQKKIQAPTVLIGFKGEGNPRVSLALSVISKLLGGGESSRLYKILVRDKKWTSYLGQSIYDFVQSSVFIISYNFTNKKYEPKIKKIVQREIDRFRKELVTPQELERVKNIIVNDIVSELKAPLSRAIYFSSYELYFNNYKKGYEEIDMLEDMKASYIQDVAKKYLKSTNRTYVVLEGKK